MRRSGSRRNLKTEWRQSQPHNRARMPPNMFPDSAPSPQPMTYLGPPRSAFTPLSVVKMRWVWTHGDRSSFLMVDTYEGRGSCRKCCRKIVRPGFVDLGQSSWTGLSVTVRAEGFLGSSDQFVGNFDPVGHFDAGGADLRMGTKGRGTYALGRQNRDNQICLAEILRVKNSLQHFRTSGCWYCAPSCPWCQAGKSPGGRQ